MQNLKVKEYSNSQKICCQLLYHTKLYPAEKCRVVQDGIKVFAKVVLGVSQEPKMYQGHPSHQVYYEIASKV